MRFSLRTLSLIALAVIAYAGAVISRPYFENLVNPSSLVRNPIYPELNLAAGRLGLDVSFARYVKTGRFDVRDNLLFNDVPPGGWDVIIFGDSALAWSFSARLVEQVSGKRVAFLAQTNAFANKGMIDLSQKIAERYLKPGGKLVYLFSAGSWEPEASKPQLTNDMRSLTEGVKPKVEGVNLRSIGVKIAEIFQRTKDILRLPDVAFYSAYIEPRVAPVRSSEKKAATFGAGCLEFQWEQRGGSVFYMCDRAKNHSPDAVDAKRAVLMTGNEPCKTNPAALPTIAAIESNVRQLKQVSAGSKIIAVPFSIDASAMWLLRCVNKDVLQEAQAMLLDLPKESKLLLGDIEYEFEGGPHVANTSSVLTSYVLGKSLSRTGTEN